MREESILSLVSDVYAAAERPELWPVFLENLSEALDSKMSVLMHHDARNRGASVATAVRIDPSSVAVYEKHYAARNIFFTASASPLVSGALLCIPSRRRDAEVASGMGGQTSSRLSTVLRLGQETEIDVTSIDDALTALEGVDPIQRRS